jgi:hypothetical protein
MQVYFTDDLETESLKRPIYTVSSIGLETHTSFFFFFLQNPCMHTRRPNIKHGF